MATWLIDKIKPKDNKDFALVDAEDVEMPDGTRLSEFAVDGGEDGYSPTVEVEEIDGGYRLTITDASGTQTVDVYHGETGPAGYTPVKGTDYWTDEDKAEIVASVLAEFESAETASF